MSLTPREIEILTTIVEDYIATAAPIGSRTVAKHSRLRLSPASMRNLMADLTEKGYLEQPHTSAGRIPTPRAFRFYLDTVLKVSPLADADRQMILSYLGSSGLEITDILRQASKLLSSLSQQVSMVLTPRQSFVRWRHIEFVLLKPGLVMTVLVLQGGIVQNKLVEVDKDVTADDLVRYANYLNHLFLGRTVIEVRAHILREMEGASRKIDDFAKRALSLVGGTFDAEEEREVFVEGTVNILDQPEFADMESMRRLLRIIEERTRLLDLLDKSMSRDGLCITLGQEADITDTCDCSLVVSPYSVKGSPLGVVGIIGPLRMDYARVVPMVDFTARILTELLKKRF